MEKLKGKLILAETETEDERAARQKKATSTINELTETEEAYLKDLDVMIEVYDLLFFFFLKLIFNSITENNETNG